MWSSPGSPVQGIQVSGKAGELHSAEAVQQVV